MWFVQGPHYPSYGTGGSPYDSQPQPPPPPQYSNTYSHPAPPPPQHSPYSQVCTGVPFVQLLASPQYKRVVNCGRGMPCVAVLQ